MEYKEGVCLTLETPSHSVAQVSLKLAAILLFQPPECLDYSPAAIPPEGNTVNSREQCPYKHSK